MTQQREAPTEEARRRIYDGCDGRAEVVRELEDLRVVRLTYVRELGGQHAREAQTHRDGAEHIIRADIEDIGLVAPDVASSLGRQYDFDRHPPPILLSE